MKTTCMKAAVLTVALSVVMAGCATTPREFEERRAQLTDRAVCEELESAKRDGNGPLQAVTNAERERRHLTVHDCYQLTSPSDSMSAGYAVLVVGVTLALTALTVVAMSKGELPSGTFSSSSGSRAKDKGPRTDGETAWRWDQYTNTKGDTVWGCRGTRFGLLVDSKFCDGQPQEDTQWPGLEQR